MAKEFQVTVETNSFQKTVNVETSNVQKTVNSVGIQGISGTAVNLESLPNVNAENLENGSLLIYDNEQNKWVASRILENQDINGAHY